MSTTPIIVTVFLILSSLTFSFNSPLPSCYSDNMQCPLSGDNLVSIETGVDTPEVCREKCLEVEDCNMFTHFGSSAHPFVNSCILLKSCASLSHCDDCTSGAVTDCTCGLSYECIVDGDNLEEAVEDVPSEGDCAQNCQNNTQCYVYTYYYSDHPADPSLCILLNKCRKVWPQQCQNCSTGPRSCYQSQHCGFSIWEGLDDMEDVAIIKENTTLHLLAGERGCSMDVAALAIGGGGSSGSFGGAGGSGYPVNGSLILPANTDIQVTVGEGIATIVQILSSQEQLLKAQKGQNGYKFDGGDGYSGGGAYGAVGGSNGGDGQMSGYGVGGIGSGINISLFEIADIILTPGKGGGSFGGGAGGILVNGHSPVFDENHQGEGFGGGGGALPPMPGCVAFKLNKTNMTIWA